MKEITFSEMHPLVNCLYIVLMLIFTMITMNPVLVLPLMVLGYIYLVWIKGFRVSLTLLILAIPVFIFACIIIPLFSHNGITPLFYINDMPFTLETVLFGLMAGAVLMTVIIWFQVGQVYIDNEKFLYLVGRLLPTIALILSLSLRMIPLFVHRYREISDGQKGLGRDKSNMGFLNKCRFEAKKISILIGWSLENSVKTGISMESRGYGAKRRTSFHLFRFRRSDASALISMILLSIYPLILLVRGKFKVNFFPQIEMTSFTAERLAALIMIIVTSLIPAIVTVIEKIRNR